MPEQVYFAGLFVTALLPILINLKVFARSSELEALRLHVAQEDARIERWVLQTFVDKDNVRALRDDLDKRLDNIDNNINELKSLLMHRGNSNG